MTKLTRRDFLKLAGIGATSAAVLALAGCGSSGNGGGESTGGNGGTTGGGKTNTGAGTASGGSTGGTPDREIVFRIQIPEDPGTFDPNMTDNNGTSATHAQIYENLFYTLDGGITMNGILAKGFEKDETATEPTYVIEIFDNIYDSDGNHITAEDVAFSFNQCIADGNQPITVGNITEVKAVEDYKIQIIFKADTFTVLNVPVRIVSQKAYEENNGMGDHPVATGPYMLESWDLGSTVVLKKNENYWNRENPLRLEEQNADKLVFKVVQETSQIAISLETGALDFSANVSEIDVPKFESNPDFIVYSEPDTMMRNLFFNQREGSIFADKRVRYACAYAIDREACLDGVFDGKGAVLNGFRHPLFGDYIPEWDNEPYFPYDLDKAKELMKEAGYENGFSCRLMTDSTSRHQALAEIIQQQLSLIKIDAEILCYDGALFNTYRFDPNAWDIMVINKTAGTCSQVWSWNLGATATSAGTTATFLDDPKLKELIAECNAAATHSPEKVNETWEYINDILPILGICAGYKYYVYAKGITETYMPSGRMIMYGAFHFDDTFVGGAGEY